MKPVVFWHWVGVTQFLDAPPGSVHVNVTGIYQVAVSRYEWITAELPKTWQLT